MNIGIGITTHNRNELVEKTYSNILRCTPNAKIVIVDDASTEPVVIKGADIFRFDSNVGIARAKNKCFELLEDCEHIFLFDDDTWPVSENWFLPYVENPEPHLMYIFKDFVNRAIGDCAEVYRDSKLVAYSHARGCMLYYHNSVLKVVGGMNPAYGRWGNEHIDLSNRIHNAGLTSFRFADVIGSSELFYSSDEHLAVTSTVGRTERTELLRKSQGLVNASRESSEYIDYKEKVNDVTGQNNIILSCYFVSQPDPQRGQWEDNMIVDCATLTNSVKDVLLVILTDSKTQSAEHNGFINVPIEASMNPYFQRWLSYYQYLRDHPEIDNVFCIDATDVTMLRNPFLYIEPGKIYCGDEPSTLSNSWLLQYNPQPFLRNFFSQNRNETLLNAGVLGGSREDVMKVCLDIVTLYTDNLSKFHNDMGSFNYILRTKYNDRLEYGRRVTNVFKSYKKYGNEWFMHK